MSTYYLQINPNTDLPSIDALRPFRAVVVVEESVMPEWQSRTSRWLVITAWFDDGPLSDVFWFSKTNAIHPTVDIENTLILHIAKLGRENELLSVYAVA